MQARHGGSRSSHLGELTAQLCKERLLLPWQNNMCGRKNKQKRELSPRQRIAAEQQLQKQKVKVAAAEQQLDETVVTLTAAEEKARLPPAAGSPAELCGLLWPGRSDVVDFEI